MDFFDFEESGDFDVVCLSLVINFVPTPDARGEMLCKTTRILRQNGTLFLCLPLACVNNSRYFDTERLLAMLTDIGFVVKETHASAKLYFVMAELAAMKTTHGVFPKTLLRSGAQRNNFHIIL